MDGALDLDVTACMTNADTGTSCDEIKEGTMCHTLVIDIPKSDLISLSVRWFLDEIMTAGDKHYGSVLRRQQC